MAADLNENLRMVRLYAVNQGDKFRPVSNEVEAVTKSDNSNEEKVEQVRAILADAPEKFWFHVERITEYLDWDDED